MLCSLRARYWPPTDVVVTVIRSEAGAAADEPAMLTAQVPAETGVTEKLPAFEPDAIVATMAEPLVQLALDDEKVPA